MATIVEHEKRKHEILQKALDVFMEEGYEDVTFQKIADRCGITRTTLYIYFKNKREIFIWSIKQLTAGIEVQLMEFIQNKELNASDCLRKMMFLVLDECKENHKLIFPKDKACLYLLGRVCVCSECGYIPDCVVEKLGDISEYWCKHMG